MNSTVPVAAAGETVAVKVTVRVTCETDALLVSTTDDDALFTTWVMEPVLATKFGSPL